MEENREKEITSNKEAQGIEIYRLHVTYYGYVYYSGFFLLLCSVLEFVFILLWMYLSVEMLLITFNL